MAGGLQRSRTLPAILLVLTVWFLTTYVFWVGYVGAADDENYARYAFLFHRPPINWWEFRMPFILAVRGSFRLFGPTELAAVLPNLIASLAIAAAIAWFAGWGCNPSWRTVAAALMAVTIPSSVGFRSTVLAPFLSGAFLIVGSVCILRGTRRVPYIGAVLLALGYATHEVSFFYVAIFCLTCLAFDWKRYWRIVLVCVAASAAVVLIEAASYKILLGDPLARFHTSAHGLENNDARTDPTSGIHGLRFYTWPIETFLFSKTFGFDLLVLMISGVFVWRRLAQAQRILFVATFLTFIYLGYGTLSPLKYQPLYRQMHYYFVVMLALCALLPETLRLFFERRPGWAPAILGGLILVHLASSAVGGRWGQSVRASQALLSFAQSHSGERFLVDKNSMDEMYILNGFRLPSNVVCLDRPGVERLLLVNQEPQGTPMFRFPEVALNGILINREADTQSSFERFTTEHPGPEETVMALAYKPALRPFVSLIHSDFLIRNRGAAVIWLQPADAVFNR